MEINQVRNDSGLDQTVKAVRSMPIYPFILQIIIDGVLCQALFFFFLAMLFSLWDLSSWTSDVTWATKARNPNH